MQIKEAVVSSTTVWHNLQRPFRAEREKLARMAELDAAQQIARQELTNRQGRETAELEPHRRQPRGGFSRFRQTQGPPQQVSAAR